MTIQLSPEIEALVQEGIAQGGFVSADAFVEQAVLMLHAQQNADETEEDGRAFSEAIEEAWVSSERGEAIDGDDAFRILRERHAGHIRTHG